MPRSYRFSAYLLFTFLLIGCGKKPDSGTSPTPEANPTPKGQQPAAPGATGIEGTYLVVGRETWGEKETPEEVAKESELDRTVKINKDRIQLKMFNRVTARYKLDPSKSPAEIDIVPEESGKKSETSYGIYKVEGGTLTLFVVGAREPQLRPRKFKTLGLSKDDKAEKRVGGDMILALKKVSDDTTFISEPPPKPTPATRR